MSLNFDSRKCNPSTPTSDSDGVLRDTLVFFCEFVGISDITEKNWKEFYARVHAIEMMDGAHRNRIEVEGPVPVLVKPEDVKRWIGLTTNASKKTPTAFKERLWRSVLRYEKECE